MVRRQYPTQESAFWGWAVDAVRDDSSAQRVAEGILAETQPRPEVDLEEVGRVADLTAKIVRGMPPDASREDLTEAIEAALVETPRCSEAGCR